MNNSEIDQQLSIFNRNHSQKLTSQLQSSTCLTPSSNSSTEQNIRKRRSSTKKLKKINFLSSGQSNKSKKFNFERGVKFADSPFIKQKKIKGNIFNPRTPIKSNFTPKPKLKKNNSFLIKSKTRNTSFDSHNIDTSFRISKEGGNDLLRNSSEIQKLGKKGINLIPKTKKRMNIKASGRTLKGFNPYIEKPNQDRKLELEFKSGKTKVRCYAVADGHGNIFC